MSKAKITIDLKIKMMEQNFSKSNERFYNIGCWMEEDVITFFIERGCLISMQAQPSFVELGPSYSYTFDLLNFRKNLKYF